MRVVALAVIPARGGSKRVPRKNLQMLGGKPLLAWTVEAAQASSVDRVVVSTEDDEIAAWCEAWGVEVIRRPPALAADGVISADVVRHALESVGQRYERVLLLHPTSPFRTHVQIDEALTRARHFPGVSVVSVTNDELNGAIYVSEVDRFLRHGTFFAPLIWPYTMDEITGMDIDTLDDLSRARMVVPDQVA